MAMQATVCCHALIATLKMDPRVNAPTFRDKLISMSFFHVLQEVSRSLIIQNSNKTFLSRKKIHFAMAEFSQFSREKCNTVKIRFRKKARKHVNKDI